jgi:hypothetical protein
MDEMFRVVTAIQQIVTNINGTVSEEGNMVAITKKNDLLSHTI